METVTAALAVKTAASALAADADVGSVMDTDEDNGARLRVSTHLHHIHTVLNTVFITVTVTLAILLTGVFSFLRPSVLLRCCPSS